LESLLIIPALITLIIMFGLKAHDIIDAGQAQSLRQGYAIALKDKRRWLCVIGIWALALGSVAVIDAIPGTVTTLVVLLVASVLGLLLALKTY
jgi:hypothetical protein